MARPVIQNRMQYVSIQSFLMQQGDNLLNFQGWLQTSGVLDQVTYVSDPLVLRKNISFADFRLVYVPSAYRPDNLDGAVNATNDALVARRADLVHYVNTLGGSLIVLTQFGMLNPYGFLPDPLTFVAETLSNVSVTADMTLFSPTSNASNLNRNIWQGHFSGPIDYSGIYRVLVYKQGQCNHTNGQHQECAATMVANQRAKLTHLPCWNKDSDPISAADPLCWRCVS